MLTEGPNEQKDYLAENEAGLGDLTSKGNTDFVEEKIETKEINFKEAIIEIVKKNDLSSPEGRIALGEALIEFRRDLVVDLPQDLDEICTHYYELGLKLKFISDYEELDYSYGIVSQEHFDCLNNLLSLVYRGCNPDVWNSLIPSLYPEQYSGMYVRMKHKEIVKKDWGRNQVCLEYLNTAISNFAPTMAGGITNNIIARILLGLHGYYPRGFIEEKKNIPELPNILDVFDNWNETRKVWADLVYKLLEGWTGNKLPQFDFNESEEEVIKQLCTGLSEVKEEIMRDTDSCQDIVEARGILEAKKDLFKKHSDIFRQILRFYLEVIEKMKQDK